MAGNSLSRRGIVFSAIFSGYISFAIISFLLVILQLFISVDFGRISGSSGSGPLGVK